MRHLLTILLLTSLLGGCATLRTLSDIGSAMCELFATENEGALGMSPAAWCSIKENLEPFIEEAFAAQRTAGAMGLNRTSGGEGR